MALTDGEIVIEGAEKEKASIFYHQTTAEFAEAIKKEGFKKDMPGGANLGQQGFIKGIFLKETPTLLDSPKLGMSQVGVELKPGIRILDLTGEYPASFVREKSAWAFPGRQAFALAGWLERNGFAELADHYHEGIRRVYSGQSLERLVVVWPMVERRLKELGYSGVKFTDFYNDPQGGGHKFPATVVFSPEDIIVKK